MGGQHASIPPSGAPIWGHCSGYLGVMHKVADFDTDATRAGTASHWAFSEAVLNDLDAEDYIGHADPDGTIVDEGMAHGAQLMVDMVREDMEKHPGGQLYIEQRVYMPDIHPDNWGTLDYAYVLPAIKRVILGDYKHGHLEVSPERNLQLVDYLKGLENLVGYTFDGWRIDLKVCQPYAYSPHGPKKVWQASRADIVPLWAQLSEQAHSDPHMTTGKHCRYCPLVGRCSAARQAGYSLISYVKEPFEVDTMTGADLEAERDILTEGSVILKARLEDIEEQLQNRLRKGEKGIGLTLRQTTGRAKWTQSDKVVITALKSIGLDVSKETTITPTQAKDKAKTEAQKAAVKALQRRPNGKIELVKLKDSPAHRAFGANQ
ncbi:hypothetical protein [Vibrio phage VP16C]|nr:hypothetical protein [Vibrio phage VP16C]